MEKFNQYLQNIKGLKAQFTTRIVIAGLILSAVLFLLFANASKKYVSSMVIFINPKSETAAQRSNQIVGNISEFPKTLALYDRLLKYNPDVKDLTAGKSASERKEYWNSLVSVRKIGKDSSLIKISITAAQKNDADQLVQKTAETLFYFSAFYYNIKNDIDLRIVEGPISYSRTTGLYWILPLSLILGFLLAFLLKYLFSSLGKAFANSGNIFKKNNLFVGDSGKEITSLEDLYAAEQAEIPFIFKEKPEENVPQEDKKFAMPGFSEIKQLTKMFEAPGKYPNFREVPKASQPKAQAPSNLPIADESIFSQPASENKPKEYKEPSEEQFKERLNKLLRGEF
jgi:hypothetical protein